MNKSVRKTSYSKKEFPDHIVRHEKKCYWCGKDFHTNRVHTKYCTSSCKGKFNRTPEDSWLKDNPSYLLDEEKLKNPDFTPGNDINLEIYFSDNKIFKDNQTKTPLPEKDKQVTPPADTNQKTNYKATQNQEYPPDVPPGFSIGIPEEFENAKLVLKEPCPYCMGDKEVSHEFWQMVDGIQKEQDKTLNDEELSHLAFENGYISSIDQGLPMGKVPCRQCNETGESYFAVPVEQFLNAVIKQGKYVEKED